jgi:hypothetical protein
MKIEKWGGAWDAEKSLRFLAHQKALLFLCLNLVQIPESINFIERMYEKMGRRLGFEPRLEDPQSYVLTRLH